MISKKSLAVIIACLLLITFFTCIHKADMQTISDISYNNCEEDNLIYIKENERYVPFIVVTDDYGGKTLLVRKDVIEIPRKIDCNSSYYEGSDIDKYLNEIYLPKIDYSGFIVEDSKIAITMYSSIGTTGIETKTINRKVFLLSCTEIGINCSMNVATEGEKLSYFEEEKNRVAYCNGNATGWWLRTPNTYYLSCTYSIGANNKVGYTNSYDANGIRPAFCVSDNLEIQLKGGVVENQMVYVLSTEK